MYWGDPNCGHCPDFLFLVFLSLLLNDTQVFFLSSSCGNLLVPGCWDLFCCFIWQKEISKYSENNIKSTKKKMLRAPLLVQRRAFAVIQSEKPCAKLSDKLVRNPLPTSYYKHPSYIMAREKMLATLWIDAGIFKYSIHALLPFFIVAMFFKA